MKEKVEKFAEEYKKKIISDLPEKVHDNLKRNKDKKLA